MIRLNIESIVIDGLAVSEAERPHLHASIARELGALMAADVQNTPRQGTSVAAVRAADLPRTGSLAARIARSIHGAIAQ